MASDADVRDIHYIAWANKSEQHSKIKSKIWMCPQFGRNKLNLFADYDFFCYDSNSQMRSRKLKWGWVSVRWSVNCA